MRKYIAILRGINVSGQKQIKMADLKKGFEGLGFQEVQTYIQSGNVIFLSPETDAIKIESKIEKKIKQEFEFEVPVIVKTHEEIQNAINNNPFIKRDENPDRLYFTFLSKVPAPGLVESIDGDKYLPEEFILKENLIYFFSPHGYGKAKMNNNFFENKLKVKATTRNWKTVNKLLELAS